MFQGTHPFARNVSDCCYLWKANVVRCWEVYWFSFIIKQICCNYRQNAFSIVFTKRELIQVLCKVFEAAGSSLLLLTWFFYKLRLVFRCMARYDKGFLDCNRKNLESFNNTIGLDSRKKGATLLCKTMIPCVQEFFRIRFENNKQECTTRLTLRYTIKRLLRFVV